MKLQKPGRAGVPGKPFGLFDFTQPQIVGLVSLGTGWRNQAPLNLSYGPMHREWYPFSESISCPKCGKM